MAISAAPPMSKAGFPGRKPIWPPNSAARSENAAPKRRHYGRRKGPSLSAHQANLFKTLLPQLALTLEADRDPRSYFPDAQIADVWLEIGFGGGEHLLWQAEMHRDIGVIGAEPYVSGVAKLLSKLSGPPHPDPLPQGGRGKSTKNIRIYVEDARDIIEALPRASIGRVFILFPDPWPKARHHKRRFIQMAMLDELARIMKPGGEIRFATDDTGYLVWALERFAAHPSFAWLARDSADWCKRPADWSETRYEAKAIREGSACTYLRFIRR
jgi:tRNA (guanine-N7-)-methyltransferase